MANRESLKSDLKLLKGIFTKDHERFQVSQTDTDHLTCQFIGENSKICRFYANLPDDYPLTPLLWYTDSDETHLMQIVEKLSKVAQNGQFLNQIDFLLRELCSSYNIKMPNEATAIMRGEGSSSQTPGTSSQLPLLNESSADKNEEVMEYDDKISASDDDDDDMESVLSDESLHFESASQLESATNLNADRMFDIPEMNKDYLDILKKVKSNAGSTIATNRLMKEMHEIYRSDAFKKGDYSIELVDDSIYDWNIELRCIDSGSALYKDLIELKEKEGKDSILLNMTFDDKYPISPPFVRVVYPVVKCKHVVGGGAFCTELLLTQCWSPVYTIESVIMQMAALLVKGNARIAFGCPVKYSLAAAKSGFDMVVNLKRTGWFEHFTESS